MATLHANWRAERQGTTLVLTLDRPPVNALNMQVLAELTQLMREVGQDPAIRAVIVTAAGERCFAAGADIDGLEELGVQQGREVNAKFQAAFAAVAACPVPVICAINGAAVGGGLELALSCDIRLVAEHAYVGLPEVALGLIPGGGGTQRLPRMIPQGIAKTMMFTGRTLGADEAHRLGLADKVVSADALLAESLSLADEIARKGPRAVRAVKTAINKGLELPLQEALELELDLSGGLFGSPESQEGLAAFRQKRPANFETPGK